MLDVSKGAVLLRNVYKHHRPAISHLKAAHYRGSVGARRYARLEGIEIPDAEALTCRHFCVASESLVVN